MSQVVYPFECRICRKEVRSNSSNRNSHAHRSGKCRKKCDGVQRNGGGWPLDQSLQSLELAARQRKLSIKRAEGEEFLRCAEWKRLRYRALLKYGRRCCCCGRQDGQLHVDHIKPRFRYPELALSFENLQVLCEDCNLGKGAWDETDWRPKES